VVTRKKKENGSKQKKRYQREAAQAGRRWEGGVERREQAGPIPPLPQVEVLCGLSLGARVTLRHLRIIETLIYATKLLLFGSS
jgi:hypothetical protein